MKIGELLRDILPTFHTLPQQITLQKPKNNTLQTKINKVKLRRVRFKRIFDATNPDILTHSLPLLLLLLLTTHAYISMMSFYITAKVQ